jgi:hypothetical protein
MKRKLWSVKHGVLPPVKGSNTAPTCCASSSHTPTALGGMSPSQLPPAAAPMMGVAGACTAVGEAGAGACKHQQGGGVAADMQHTV